MQNSAKFRIKVSPRQLFRILFPYIKSKILFQVKSVSIIVIYLALFQIMILGIPIKESLTIIGGIALVIVGLAFFLEGVMIGIMPLGEYAGKKLPQKTKLPMILLFAFVVGIVATLAEPAITILYATGSFVKAWEAPLLFAFLNKYSFLLVISISAGVGIAVLFGVLRFVYSWSLKPFIYILTLILLSITVYAFFDANLITISGLAWDSGGITTGPVTVPLIIALGFGISRVLGSNNNTSGLGVVTLASAFPIITVMLLGMGLSSFIPAPAPESVFFLNDNLKSEQLFEDKYKETGYVLAECSGYTAGEYLKKNNLSKTGIFNEIVLEPAAYKKYFKSIEDLRKWITKDPILTAEAAARGLNDRLDNIEMGGGSEIIFFKNLLVSLQAILPLTLFLLFILKFCLKERIPRSDEISLGIIISIVGMTLFTTGIGYGLSNIGNQVGSKLPSAFKSIEIPEDRRVIRNFDKSLLKEAVAENGQRESFFYSRTKDNYKAIVFDEKNYDHSHATYTYIPLKGPLTGKTNGFAGFLIVIIFAFFMGYSVTLAEPALNALGISLEELTVGIFKRKLLMQSVAAGVGIGMGFGVIKIIFDIPLIYLLAPPYLLLLVLTYISNEDFVNIAWDSAGVTTGPITVPLVIAMGLGIGSQLGMNEGFGILAMASAYPIVSVLVVGLFVESRRRKLLNESQIESESQKEIFNDANKV